MRHPKRRLQEFLDNEASPARAAAVQAHLSRCAACRAEAARERRLRSRLKSAQIPVPEPGLREQLERSAMPGGAGSRGYTELPAPKAPNRRRRGLRFAAGAAAAVGLVLSTAYLLGGWSQQAMPAASTPTLAAAWSEVTGGEGHQLTAGQIEALRTHGWTCPELRAVGMSLVAAHSGRVGGQPAVVMTLEGNGSTVTVYETRSDSGGREPAVDGISGHTVTEEGFVLRDEGSRPGRPKVWLHPQRPHHAVVSSERVTYSVAAAPEDKTLEDAVTEISLIESSRLVRHQPDTAQDLWDRIQHGLSVMTGAGS
ncbi:zf-HC2 domain-containing protein [Arthrobacter sp. ATA002]|uniref:zf-HC2 domain-containing protein n=1 Tax=Arthrobacter sp. ATA002 TaxID=2991715 RepID=UPI0022A7B613|nr:zf-HC2 domain-containing protein [Arthrobacter sp. ATA002]WAP52680.1 zf-HC2 domain-containing protein [Arthrobacter sp. ATA002]